MMLDSIIWKKLPETQSTELHATHEGVLAVGGVTLRCYQLSDGRRVFDADDVRKFFDEEVEPTRLTQEELMTSTTVKRKFRASTCRVHRCLMEAARDGYCGYHEPAAELQRVDHLIRCAEMKLVRLRERRREVEKRL